MSWVRTETGLEGNAMEFRVVVEPQSNGFHAYCPNLRGCHSWGETPEEAMQYMEEALQYYVDNIDDGDPFDDDSGPSWDGAGAVN